MFEHLCIKLLGVNTPTFVLDDSTIYRIVELTNQWCENKLGTNDNRGCLTIHIKNQPYFTKPTYGGYDISSNIIVIHKNRCENIEFIIKTILHEYVHYLQDIDGYDSMMDEFGYENHPLEIEANSIMNDYYSVVWNDIKKACTF